MAFYGHIRGTMGYVNNEGGMDMVKAVVGANWGDEGKGKITDMLAQEADIIVRCQ